MSDYHHRESVKKAIKREKNLVIVLSVLLAVSLLVVAFLVYLYVTKTERPSPLLTLNTSVPTTKPNDVLAGAGSNEPIKGPLTEAVKVPYKESDNNKQPQQAPAEAQPGPESQVRGKVLAEMSGEKYLTAEELLQAMKEPKTTTVVIVSNGCGACRQMKATLQGLKSWNNVALFDVNEMRKLPQEVTSQLAAGYIPQLSKVGHGNITRGPYGAKPLDVIEQYIQTS